MGPSATVQHLRHIAVQGLPPKLAVAEMVDALDHLIPTRTKIFFWVGDQLAPHDFYEREPLLDALDAYMCQAQQLAADPEEPSFDMLANSPVEYGGWRRFQTMPRWDRSVLKNEVFRPYGIGNNLDFTIRHNGRSVGVLAIAREPGSTPYSRREIETVLATREHFRHAMTAPEVLSASADRGDGDVAIALVQADGTVAQADDRAGLLLHQLARPLPFLRLRGEPAPAPVREVIRRLALARDGRGEAPPSLATPTLWGTIRVTAHTVSGNGEYVISLQRLVPRQVPRMRRSIGLDLSPREREVALAMCEPGDGDAIARRSGLSAASYREYARRIYRRLGVEGRAGVAGLLGT